MCGDRVDNMMLSGLLDEVRNLHALIASHSDPNVNNDEYKGIQATIGYKELLPFIHKETQYKKADHEKSFDENMITQDLDNILKCCVENVINIKILILLYDLLLYISITLNIYVILYNCNCISLYLYFI
jgi:hypothetical protein